MINELAKQVHQICPQSPSKEHEYDLFNYRRDDQGFYLTCTHCGHFETFNVDTEEDFFELFDLNDDDDDDYDPDNYEVDFDELSEDNNPNDSRNL